MDNDRPLVNFLHAFALVPLGMAFLWSRKRY